MALPPTIPTSFVPHTTTASNRTPRANLPGIFSVIAYALLAIALFLAIAVFFYGRILNSQKAAKDASLVSAQAAIDPATVEGFIQLRNRLSASKTLLENHVAFSVFFSALEKMLPTNVRFTSLHLSLTEDGVSKVEGVGVAKSFNALAATSNAFAEDGRIKDAIFSNISVNADSSVSFALSAKLDPKIIAFSPEEKTVETVEIPTP